MKIGMVRTQPDDDFMHPVESDVHFSESAYYNFGDPDSLLGGLFRLGNRPNDGYAEMTNCLFLPDRRVAFWYLRPEIDGNEAHDAGGLRVETVTPHVEHRVRYDGPVLLLERPAEMEDPRSAFKSNPRADCQVDLVFRGVADTYWPWTIVDEDGDTADLRAFHDALHGMFARNHLNQHLAVTGSVTIGSEVYPVGEGGLGWRDRSWGPRSWQQIPWYKWSGVSFGPDLGLALIVFGDDQGTAHPRGYVHQGYGSEPQRIIDGHFETTYDEHWYTQAARMSVKTEDGTSYELDGTVHSHIPLRFRNRENRDIVTRVTEGMITWEHQGRTGVGIIEYLDQMVDGRPVSTIL